MALAPLTQVAPTVLSAVAVTLAAYYLTPTWSSPHSLAEASADARYRRACPRQASSRPGEWWGIRGAGIGGGQGRQGPEGDGPGTGNAGRPGAGRRARRHPSRPRPPPPVALNPLTHS